MTSPDDQWLALMREPEDPVEPARLSFAVGQPGPLCVRVEDAASGAVAVPRAISSWGSCRHSGAIPVRELPAVSPSGRFAALPFSSILPKIILPLAVCSTLVTEISTDRPIILRA